MEPPHRSLDKNVHVHVIVSFQHCFIAQMLSGRVCKGGFICLCYSLFPCISWHCTCPMYMHVYVHVYVLYYMYVYCMYIHVCVLYYVFILHESVYPKCHLCWGNKSVISFLFVYFVVDFVKFWKGWQTGSLVV